VARALEGIPIGIKDNINIKGCPTIGGSPSLLGNISKYDCTLWSILKEYDMINCGKTNMHEFCYGAKLQINIMVLQSMLLIKKE
jgi:Asp-tRNA(Asn)/Glu-tRNA(Gln) amidotransferase A subunit family amidase